MLVRRVQITKQLDLVLQLSHVPGPGVVGQGGRHRSQLHGLFFHVATIPAEKKFASKGISSESPAVPGSEFGSRSADNTGPRGNGRFGFLAPGFIGGGQHPRIHRNGFPAPPHAPRPSPAALRIWAWATNFKSPISSRNSVPLRRLKFADARFPLPWPRLFQFQTIRFPPNSPARRRSSRRPTAVGRAGCYSEWPWPLIPCPSRFLR